MTTQWEDHFHMLREAEMSAFGDKSYFFLQQEDLLPELISEDAEANMDMDEIPEDLEG